MLLFILYVNDFPTQLKAYLFADDTKCLHAAKTNEDFIAIQEDFNMACKRSKECSLNCLSTVVKVLFYTFGVIMRPQLNIYLTTFILR